MTLCRGKAESGDVDVLVTHSKVERTEGLLLRIVDRLKEVGFLVDDLSKPSGRTDHEQDSYMGVCKLAASADGVGRLHRHIDIKVYKPQHFPFAILYFTGSDHFNRSMRYFAKRKGFTLSDTHLARAVRVGKTKVHTMTSTAVKCKTEQDIFSALGLKYIKPTLRHTYEHWAATMDDEDGHANGADNGKGNGSLNDHSNSACGTP